MLLLESHSKEMTGNDAGERERGDAANVAKATNSLTDMF